MLDSTMRMVGKMISPYQSNPGNVNPLLTVLEAQVDFEVVACACKD